MWACGSTASVVARVGESEEGEGEGDDTGRALGDSISDTGWMQGPSFNG